MHTIIRRATGLGSSLPLNRTCRLVGGRRYRLRPAPFHSSAGRCRSQDDPATATDSSLTVGPGAGVPEETPENGAAAPAATSGDDLAPDRASRTREVSSSYGSAARRAARNRKPKEIPPVEIPGWFQRNNVLLHDELEAKARTLEITHDGAAAASNPVMDDPSAQETITPADAPQALPDREAQASSPRYQLHQNIWNEVLANIRSGLSLPTSVFSESFAAQKVHVLLQCPRDGGIYLLDSVVEKAALAAGADLLRLDAQDMAEIGGNYLGEGGEPSPYSIRSLAYEAQRLVAKQDPAEVEEVAGEQKEDGEMEDEDNPSQGRGFSAAFGVPVISKISIVPARDFVGTPEDFFRFTKAAMNNLASPSPHASGSSMQPSRNSPTLADQWEEMKMSGLTGAMLDVVDAKMRRSRADVADVVGQEQAPRPDGSFNQATPSPGVEAQRPLVVQIRDYKEIRSTRNGESLIRALMLHVRRRRKHGQAVMIIGTVSSAELVPALSQPGFRSLQSEFEDGPGRTIIVTPARSAAQDDALGKDARRRIRQINLRHLQDMLRQRIPLSMGSPPVLSQTDLPLDSSVEYSSGLEESVWTFDHVHRVAVTALGLVGAGEEVTAVTISTALQVLDSSDETKFQWALDEEQTQKSVADVGIAHVRADPSIVSSSSSTTTDPEARMKQIRKDCNSYEKKLLGGVVDRESIRTTFAHVHVPPETVTALKTLTTLSLIRPDAFTYGVLATDRIPGLLLYGPPGTGKTLLAKAVAKESGATMLEVSGSDVYNMFVGEGEKNIKAIFTLARKLSPCVVFIDEADAIFASRGGQANRASHRELINQFLREWDGMNDLSAFIMVATNRPFDLDDAVLRRLPRRLLVDLPVERDREAILRIHLQGEQLDTSVSVSELAQRTPFYSGSDLKNLSVAAALACVREETSKMTHLADEAGDSIVPSSPNTVTSPSAVIPATPVAVTPPPERRILAKRHFDGAMEEISASISEDMSSLAAIRKFDEKYGDRKGRRKKKRMGWGFGNATEAEQQLLETGRVRN